MEILYGRPWKKKWMHDNILTADWASTKDKLCIDDLIGDDRTQVLIVFWRRLQSENSLECSSLPNI
jgi:hypothetical protein